MLGLILSTTQVYYRCSNRFFFLLIDLKNRGILFKRIENVYRNIKEKQVYDYMRKENWNDLTSFNLSSKPLCHF